MKHLILSLLLVVSGLAQTQKIEKTNENPASSYYNRTTIGLLAGEQSSPSFNVINGYRFASGLGFGLGLGTESYQWNLHYSCFAEASWYFGRKPARPFVALNLGMSEPVRQDHWSKGGAFTGLSAGITHFTWKHFGLTTSIGYRFSILDYRDSWWDDYLVRGYFHQLELRVGFSLM